jgi:cytochrome P450
VVSKYDDARTALRTPDVFSSSRGILLNDAKVGESVADTFYDRDAELLVTLDPPRHGVVRRALASTFTPKRIAAMEEAIRSRRRELVGERPADTPFDFVHDVARVIPIFTIGKLLGIPDDEPDIDKIAFWSDEQLKGLVEEGKVTPRVARAYPAAQAAEAHRRLALGGTRGRLVLVFGDWRRRCGRRRGFRRTRYGTE